MLWKQCKEYNKNDNNVISSPTNSVHSVGNNNRTVYQNYKVFFYKNKNKKKWKQCTKYNNIFPNKQCGPIIIGPCIKITKFFLWNENNVKNRITTTTKYEAKTAVVIN